MENPDFKVLVWYRRDDPLATFKSQVYDLRKREYTPAVDTWIKEISVKYPAYIVVVRGVDLRREAGQTESLKVGSVIKRELIAAAGLAGIFVGSGPDGMTPGPLLPGSRESMRVRQLPSYPRFDRSFLEPEPYSLPISSSLSPSSSVADVVRRKAFDWERGDAGTMGKITLDHNYRKR